MLWLPLRAKVTPKKGMDNYAKKFQPKKNKKIKKKTYAKKLKTLFYTNCDAPTWVRRVDASFGQLEST